MLAAPAKPPPFSERPLPVTQEETEARAGGCLFESRAWRAGWRASLAPASFSASCVTSPWGMKTSNVGSTCAR